VLIAETNASHLHTKPSQFFYLRSFPERLTKLDKVHEFLL